MQPTKRGRKPTVIINPFVREDEFGTIENILMYEDELDIRVEDIIIGAVRSFKADLPKANRQEYVNWFKVVKIYRNLNEISRPLIQVYLACSEAQAKRYIRVLKTANTLLERTLEGNSGSNVVGYPKIEFARASMTKLIKPKLENLARYATSE